MFEDELLIGSIRTQANRLKEVLSQMEMDIRWKEHGAYYAREIHDIERSLKKIRKEELELINRFN